MHASSHPDSSAVLKARLRNARGGMTDVTVLDLSAAGCMVDAQGTGLREEDRVLVKMEGLEFMPGTVLWIDPELELFVIFLSNRVHPDGKGLVNPLAGRIGTVTRWKFWICNPVKKRGSRAAPSA